MIQTQISQTIDMHTGWKSLKIKHKEKNNNEAVHHQSDFFVYFKMWLNHRFVKPFFKECSSRSDKALSCMLKHKLITTHKINFKKDIVKYFDSTRWPTKYYPGQKNHSHKINVWTNCTNKRNQSRAAFECQIE